MENLFTVFVLIATSVLFYSFYYSARRLHRARQKRKIRKKIHQKIYEDERTYLKSYLRVLLDKLKTGDLAWILISSRIYPHDKLEITINPSVNDLLVKTRLRKINSGEIQVLKKMGLKSFIYRDEINSFTMPVNTKIVTDVIYYCLEEIGEQDNLHNVKIITSGGSFQWLR